MSADRLQQIQLAKLEDPVLPLLSDVIKAGWPNNKRSVPPATLEDPVLPLLSNVIKAGWPNNKRSVHPAVLPSWDARDELVIDG